MFQFMRLGIVVNVHLVLFLWVGKYQRYLQEPVAKLPNIRYHIPNFCAHIENFYGAGAPKFGIGEHKFGIGAHKFGIGWFIPTCLIDELAILNIKD